MFVEAVFKSSFGFTYVLFGALFALYHVNDVFRVTVNVISDRSVSLANTYLTDKLHTHSTLQAKPDLSLITLTVTLKTSFT